METFWGIENILKLQSSVEFLNHPLNFSIIFFCHSPTCGVSAVSLEVCHLSYGSHSTASNWCVVPWTKFAPSNCSLLFPPSYMSSEKSKNIDLTGYCHCELFCSGLDEQGFCSGSLSPPSSHGWMYLLHPFPYEIGMTKNAVKLQ